jgi:perosamine synthetase
VGSLADLSVFSFHPVKAIATGEGGAITTDDPQVAARMRRFRNHGISSDHRERTSRGGHAYDMVELGWNYRLSDIQCALGLNQLKKLPDLIARRQTLASTYDKAISGMDSVSPLKTFTDREHAYHLYTVTLNTLELGIMRDAAFEVLRAGRIGVNVHYRPVHLHSFYRKNYGTAPGLCPKAESAYENILTLPLFPDMADKDISDVICTIRNLRNAT